MDNNTIKPKISDKCLLASILSQDIISEEEEESVILSLSVAGYNYSIGPAATYEQRKKMETIIKNFRKRISKNEKA
jgi:hypothetical protein